MSIGLCVTCHRSNISKTVKFSRKSYKIFFVQLSILKVRQTIGKYQKPLDRKKGRYATSLELPKDSEIRKPEMLLESVSMNHLNMSEAA